MGYADLDDVESGFRTLSDEERNRCFYLLEEAAVIIDAYGREADPDVKRLVSCRMVRRLLGDGTGGETPYLFIIKLPFLTLRNQNLHFLFDKPDTEQHGNSL